MKYCEINLKFEGFNEGYMINIGIVCGYICIIYYDQLCVISLLILYLYVENVKI